MGSILILVVLLFLLLLMSITFSKRELVTPQFAFSLSFLVSAVYAIPYVNIWSLNLTGMTILVIVGGNFLFFAVSHITEYVYTSIRRPYNKQSTGNYTHRQNSAIFIERWKLLFLFIMQVGTTILTMRFLTRTSGTGLSAAIYYFRQTNLFTTQSISMPAYLTELRLFSIASGYIILFVFLNNLIVRDRQHILLQLMNIAISVVNNVILGGRGGALTMLVAAAVQYYLLWVKHRGRNRFFSFRKVLTVMLIAAATLFIFAQSLVWLGRTLKYDFSEYIAIYLSAQIKNLDLFIREGRFGAPPERWQTLLYVVNFLSNLGFHRDWHHKLDVPFRKINGHSLGNVATTYYAFLYDGGIFAVIIFIIIMAIISQLTYRAALRDLKNRSARISIPIIAYSYLFFTLLFSFFSNKFYEMLFTPTYVKMMIYWYICVFFLTKTRSSGNMRKLRLRD